MFDPTCGRSNLRSIQLAVALGPVKWFLIRQNWRFRPRSASIAGMATITIRRLDETTKRRLRVRAADHGRSMEEEAREILKSAVAVRSSEAPNLVESVRRRLEPLGFVDLPEVPRELMRQPPPLDK